MTKIYIIDACIGDQCLQELIEKAINNGLSVRKEWERRPLKERADILLKAADLAAGKYRMDLNAATMLGQVIRRVHS